MLSIWPKSTAVSPAPLMLTFSVPAVKVTLSVAAWLVNQPRSLRPPGQQPQLRSANWQKPQLHLPSLLVLFLAFQCWALPDAATSPSCTVSQPLFFQFRGKYSYSPIITQKKTPWRVFYLFLGVSFSSPFIYGRRALGMVTLPSAFWWFSSRGMRIRGEAIPVLFRV